MIRYFILVCVFILSACTPGGQSGKISAAEVVGIVQKAESTYPGVTTSDAIAGLLGVLKNRGGAIDIIGWSQDYRSGGTHDVWFKVKVNDDLSEFHWVVTPDGTITPSNNLAQNVTKKQLATAR